MNQLADFEIVTFNVRGLHDFTKRKDVFNFLRSESADIICLQEVHIAPGEEHIFRSQWGGRAWFSPLTSAKGGVGVLIKNKTGCKITDAVTSNSGNTVILHLEVNDTKLLIINLYGPHNEDDPAFFEDIFEKVSTRNHDNVIICGDWNLTMNPEKDTYNYAIRDRRHRARNLVKQKCAELNLHDIWRMMNENKKQFTWRKNNPVKCARLDFFLISESLLNKTVSCDIIPSYRSDHSRVLLKLNLIGQPRGKGFWKLNCSLLKDMKYLEMVKKVIQETISSYACPVYSESYVDSPECRQHIQFTINDALFLETLLMKIRTETISYSIRRKKERTEKDKHILNEIHILESLSNPSEEDIEKIAAKQTEILNERTKANEGRIIRSRAQWYEEGEKSSSYFLNLEKRNYDSKIIPSLIMEGREFKSNDDILCKITEHFANLFKKHDDFLDSEVISYLTYTTCLKLSSLESESLEGEISIEELGETLKMLSNNRSPGSDGFPYEFFKIFWGDIKHFVHRSLVYGLNNGELSITQREGLITLVPKPSKPRNVISGWRPITLLNSTYKILSATVANRLKRVMNSIINPDQTAFLKQRFIGENTRVVYDVLWEAYQKKERTSTLCRFYVCV